MAAHAHRILTHSLNLLGENPAQGISYLQSGMNAPGTCFTSYFPTEHYFKISSLLEKGDTPSLIQGLEETLKAVAWMGSYRTLEEVRAVVDAYVRYGRPHFQRRLQGILNGDPAAHAKARMMAGV